MSKLHYSDKTLGPNLLSFCVYILTLFVPLIFWANFTPFYINQFEKHNVYELFETYNIDRDKVDSNFNELMAYIQFRRSDLPENFYSPIDIHHMKDVKNMFKLVYVSTIISALGTIILALKLKENKLIAIRHGATAALMNISLIILISLVLSFDTFFTLFHKASFNNNDWLLDPAVSNLIKYFPTELFETQAIYIAASIFIVSLLELGVSFMLINKRRTLKLNSEIYKKEY